MTETQKLSQVIKNVLTFVADKMQLKMHQVDAELKIKTNRSPVHISQCLVI